MDDEGNIFRIIIATRGTSQGAIEWAFEKAKEVDVTKWRFVSHSVMLRRDTDYECSMSFERILD